MIFKPGPCLLCRLRRFGESGVGVARSAPGRVDSEQPTIGRMVSAAGWGTEQTRLPGRRMRRLRVNRRRSRRRRIRSQSSVDIFHVRHCRGNRWCFPDLATAGGPLSSWDKLKLAANNTVSLFSVGGAVIGSAYGQAINQPGGLGTGLGCLRPALWRGHGPGGFVQLFRHLRNCLCDP